MVDERDNEYQPDSIFLAGASAASDEKSVQGQSMHQSEREKDAPDYWDHSRAWNLPMGWVVPGIVHPDDVIEDDEEEDLKAIEQAGEKMPRTSKDVLAAFVIAANNAAANLAIAGRDVSVDTRTPENPFATNE